MSHSLFEHSGYRDAIQDLCRKTNLSYRAISKETGIHASYFSRVMVGDAEFSGDQIYKIAHVFNLSEKEIDYLILLRDHDASANHQFRGHLKKKVEWLQKEYQKLMNRLDAKNRSKESSEERIRVFYETPFLAKVLMYLTIVKYQRSREALASVTGLSPKKISEALRTLERLGLVTLKSGGAVPTEDFIHLDESHPSSLHNHVNWRLEAISSLQKKSPDSKDYNFSVCFSADEEAKVRIRELFKAFVVEAQKIVAEVKNPDVVAAMTFDLFEPQ